MTRQYEILSRIEKECLTRGSESLYTSTDGYCDVIWDGIACWPKTKADTLAVRPCPDYFGFETQYAATKYCTGDGTWFVNTRNVTWTNYSQCMTDYYRTSLVTIGPYIENSTVMKQWFPVVKTVSQIGYGVSLATLIIAIFIFSTIKKLRCARNRLHMHLFVSFSMRAFMALLKDTLFVEGVAMITDVIIIDDSIVFSRDPYTWVCKFITSAWEYFILANYFWILMEGVYLHNLIFTSMFSDNSAITLYVCLGWALPSIFIITWVLARIYFEDTLCWTIHSSQVIFMIIRMPIVFSVLISFALFINIVRVLLVKLNSVYIQRRKVRYRRLVRSTLVLVPLFGVHYSVFLAMSYAIDAKPTVELIWLFCDQLFASFQGFCVAMLYCLLNGEVRAELSRKFSAWRDRGLTHRPPPYASVSCRGQTSRTSAAAIPLTEIRKP